MSLSYRTFNSPGGPATFGVQYVGDSGLLMSDGSTGGFRPVFSDDFGTTFLAAISGNTAFLRTGSLGVSNPIGVTGVRVDAATGYGTTNYLMVGGRAVVTSGFAPTYPSGANAVNNVDTQNGGALVQITDLDKSNDSVVAYPPQFNSVSQAVPSGASAAITTGVALASNPNRNEFYCQVVGSGSPLFVAFNSAAAGTGNFNVILKPSTAMWGGDGGVLSNSTYQGAVSVSGGPFCYFSIWEA